MRIGVGLLLASFWAAIFGFFDFIASSSDSLVDAEKVKDPFWDERTKGAGRRWRWTLRLAALLGLIGALTVGGAWMTR